MRVSARVPTFADALAPTGDGDVVGVEHARAAASWAPGAVRAGHGRPVAQLPAPLRAQHSSQYSRRPQVALGRPSLITPSPKYFHFDAGLLSYALRGGCFPLYTKFSVHSKDIHNNIYSFLRMICMLTCSKPGRSRDGSGNGALPHVLYPSFSYLHKKT